MHKIQLVLPLLIGALVTACGETAPPVASTIISNARIHDGSGSDAFDGAVRIDGDRIMEIGNLEPLAGETIIDAGGLVLAPGFIDSHSHHSGDIEEFRHMPGVLSQGVTTIVRGLDGSASGRLADYSASYNTNPAAVNIATFSPHNTIRREVMGDDYRREASADEIAAMAELVAADMQAGALGLGTGLEYEPGIFSNTKEVIELAKVASSFNGRYSSHVRDEDDRFMDAIDELLQVGREADIPVNISHIKLAYRDYWGTTADVIGKLNAARESGVQVTADIYPYQRWQSNLAVLFPERDFTDRSVAKFTFEHTVMPEDLILSWFGPDENFNGMSVAEIAGVLEMDVESTLLELTQAADDYRKDTGSSGASIIARGMDEGDVAAFMKWEFTNICSDGGHGGGHPRGYGSFPRVLGRFVRTLKVLTLEEAIYKTSGLTAESLGLQKRGRIQTGYFADLVLFDPETIADKATMTDSTALSVGVKKVWVNGVLAFDEGKPTMAYPGRAIARDEL